MTSSFKSLRYTTAIAVSLVALSTANQANAQCTANTGGDDIVTCTTAVLPGRPGYGSSGGNDTVNIGVGQIIDNTASNGGARTLESDGNTGYTLNNDGILQYTGTNVSGDALFIENSTGDFTVNNTGSILQAGGTGPTNNSVAAAIQVSSSAILDTITITNSGEISSVRQGILVGLVNSSNGNFTPGTYDSSLITNQTGGLIQATSGLETGGTNRALFLGVGDDVVINEVGATIDGRITLAGGDDVLTNSGMLLDVTTLDFGSGNDILTNNASATIEGDVILGSGDDVILNEGTITSDVFSFTNDLGTIRLNSGSGADQITNTVTGLIEATGSDKRAIDIDGATVDFIRNAGTIQATAEAIFLRNGGADLTGGLLNEATGRIIGNTDGASSSGLNGNDTIRIDTNLSGGIDNRGLIEDRHATAIGLEFANVTGAINNSGTITGELRGIVLSSSVITMGIDNSGTINGGISGISLGSSSSDIVGGITNRGTISGDSGSAISVVFSNNNISGGITNEVGGIITGDTAISVDSSNAISGGIDTSGIIEGTGGTAISLTNLSAVTPITINGGRIIGDVFDNDIVDGRSPVTVTGSGFRTEGNFTVSDLMVDAGQDFMISSDNIVTLNDMTASDGSLIFELGASSNAFLDVTGGDVDISDSIIGAVNNGLAFRTGDTVLIGQGIGTVNNGTGQALEDVNEDLLFFDLEVADGATAGAGTDNEVYLVVSDSASNPCTGQFANNPDGACGALRDLTGTTNLELQRVISNTDSAGAEDILEATLPQIDGASFSAAQNVTGNTLRLVSDRLTVIRDGGGSRGISSGDLTEDIQVWGQVFGQSLNQGLRKGIAGFDATTRGVTVGADSDSLYDDATIGVAFSYANTDVRSRSVNNTSSDIDSYNLSLYGDYDLSDDTYLIGDIGYTYGDNESTRFNIGGVTGLNADSDYGSHQVEARVIAARDYNLTQHEGVRVTPRVQAHYIRYQNEDISETGAGGAGLEIDSEALHILELGVGVDVRKDYAQENGGILSPEISFGYRYDVIGDAVETTSTFATGGPSFRTEGADPDQDTFNLGVGVGYTAPNSMEFTASYDYESKDEFNSHSAFLRAAMPF